MKILFFLLFGKFLRDSFGILQTQASYLERRINTLSRTFPLAIPLLPPYYRLTSNPLVN